MDSPDVTKTTTSASPSPSSPPIKDSPFSSYVSSLSPIQPVNARNDFTAYRDLSYSPEPVFTSPHIAHRRKLDKSDATTFPENILRTGPPNSSLIIQLTHGNYESEDNPSSECETSGGSSSCVDVFLADELEICDNASAPPECLRQAAEMPQNVHGSCTRTNENQIESYEEDCVALSSSAPEDEFITDPVEHSNLHNLQSKSTVVLPPFISSNCMNSEEMNSANHVFLTKKDFYSKSTECLSLSSNAEKHPGADEATYPFNLSLDDCKTKIADEATGADRILLDEQPVPITENNNIDTDSFMAPLAVHQSEMKMVDQNRTDDVSSGSDGKDNDDLSHEKPIATSAFCHKTRDVTSQISAAQEPGKLHSTPQFLPEPLQDVQAFGGDPDVSVEKFIVSAENQILYEEGTDQNQRGMRKRLQFEAIENQKANTECEKPFNNVTGEVSCAEPPELSVDMNTSNPSHVEPIETSGMKQGSQSGSQSCLCKLVVKVDVSGQKKGCSSVTDPRPAGIGLHLNSIGSVGHINCSTVVQLPGKDSCMEDKSFLGDNDQQSQGSNSELLSPGIMGQSSVTLNANSELLPDGISEDTGEEHLEDHVMELAISSVSHQTPLYVKPIQCSMQSKLIDRYMTPCNLKRPLSVDDSKFNMSSQSSPRKKKKKASDNEGQKRCSCKRSKCLKLYCDCFAAGTFCSEACGCQQCVNRPENEDTIREAKQQIESRNPLAFAPKVVHCVSDPPKDSEESMGRTPNSARHKRGCNCKKSLCLKKYCECYQAGVGCSFGCRCEGCKNTFGKRDGCPGVIEIEHKKSKEQKWEIDSPAENLKEKLVKREMSSRLSPLTPSIQGSNGVDLTKSLLPISYYASPETSASALPYYEASPGSPLTSIKNTFEDAREDTMAMVPYDPELDFDIKVNAFSPGWDGFPDICNLSPFSNPSPCNDGASASSKIREPRILPSRLFQGNSLALGHLRCSPVTPLPQLGESKRLLEPDFENGQNKSLMDSTPEILKDTCLPIKAVKASSPKQKRVSPPKRRSQETRSTYSTGLRSGRKFILQSVPPFPSLTSDGNNNRGSGT